MRMLVCYYSLFVLFEVILIGISREVVVDGVGIRNDWKYCTKFYKAVDI